MSPGFPILIASPIALIVAAGLWLGTALIAWLRPPAIRRSALIFMAIGMLCLVLAAGGLTWRHQRAGRVAVVVDVSPSTRTATFHTPSSLQSRLSQLLPGVRYKLYAMSEQTAAVKGDRLPIELPAKQTHYGPPPADAVVLFSDGQFDVPHAPPPTWCIVDPMLEHPRDGRVQDMHDNDGRLLVSVDNGSDHERQLRISGALPATRPVAPGRYDLPAVAQPDASRILAFLLGNDPWRENDALLLQVPPPAQFQRWWVGGADPGAGWKHLDPHELPGRLPAYLGCAVIVLDNVPADDLNRDQQVVLDRYVRSLGGGLLIVGGDHAFAAGGYAGTLIERLSPLASTPPRPTTQWVLLADSSGSMAASIGDNSRFAFAVDAMQRLVRRLPPDDIVSVGSFAQRLRWWRGQVPVHVMQGTLVMPRDLRPTGPTNLAPALDAVAASADSSMPTQLVLLTDAEARIDHPEALAQKLKQAGVRVSALATGDVPENNPLRRIVELTGGRMLSENDPRQWAARLHQLVSAISPDLLHRDPMTIDFTPAGLALPAMQVSPWNRTWVKSQATLLARGAASAAATQPQEQIPAIAAWNVGSGACISAAFAASRDVIDRLCDRVAMPARDPRYSVAWKTGADLIVTLDAYDPADGYLNGLSPRLELSSDGRRVDKQIPLAQIGPGRYRAEMPAPDQPMIASVFADGRAVDRRAIAGRYPREFDAIGNNHPALESLARSSGGQVIMPDQTKPIDFQWPTAKLDLSRLLAVLGAALLAIGLIRWRMG